MWNHCGPGMIPVTVGWHIFYAYITWPVLHNKYTIYGECTGSAGVMRARMIPATGLAAADAAPAPTAKSSGHDSSVPATAASLARWKCDADEGAGEGERRAAKRCGLG